MVRPVICTQIRQFGVVTIGHCTDETSLMHITCGVHLDKKCQTVVASYTVV